MLTGGLLPFPRTGCVLYAKAILSYGSEIRQALPAAVSEESASAPDTRWLEPTDEVAAPSQPSEGDPFGERRPSVVFRLCVARLGRPAANPLTFLESGVVSRRTPNAPSRNAVAV